VSPAMALPTNLLKSILMAAAMLFATQAAAAAPPLVVTVSRAGDGIRVDYDLPAPVAALRLGLQAQSPAANIRAEGDGFSFRRGEVSAQHPFTHATLIVTPDGREVDSVYPLLLPVEGRGFVLYAPYLMPASGPARLNVVGASGRKRAVRDDSGSGYVLVGAEPQNHRLHRSLMSVGTPDSIRAALDERAARLLAFYRERLGQAGGVKPTIILAYSAAATQRPFRGDVTPNGMVFLRIGGDAAHAADPAAIDRYANFLSHELFHLWNRSGDSRSGNWWLHEGGAEYASWLAASTLWPSTATMERRLNDAMKTCAIYLGAKPLADLSDIEARGVRYPCGALIQWIADVGLRAEGKGDVFALWKRLRAVRQTKGSYTPDDFFAALAELAPRALPAAESIVRGSGVERWTRLAETLNAMGAGVEVGPPAPFLLRLAAAKPLVLSACGEAWGVGDGEHGLFVQAPESCSAFGDSPVIEQAAGIAPMADPLAFYERVRAVCASGGEVALSLSANGKPRTERVKCSVPVEPPPPDLKIVHALPGQASALP
jgi:hypothetical protein